MAETTINAQAIVAAGLTPSYAAANADGSRFLCPSDERLFLHVKNANAATRTVTVVAQRTSAQVQGAGVVAIPNMAVVVPVTTGDKMIGPIPPAYVDDDGYAHITFSAVADLTVALVSLARVG